VFKTLDNVTQSLKYYSLQHHALGNITSVEASSSQSLLQFPYRKEAEEQYEKDNFYADFFSLF